MTKLSKRETTLLVILLIALCGALYYNFVLKTYFAKSANIVLKTGEVMASLNDSKAKTASIMMLDKNIKEMQDAMAQKSATVLDSIDRPAIIVMLDKILLPQATNITLGFSSAYQDLKSNYITTVEVTFQCTGQEFRQILTKLKAATYVNRVVASSLMIVDPASDTCNAAISIEILTSSVKPTKTVLAG